jgi:hypothetical protein
MERGMIRQGDILLVPIDEFPAGVEGNLRRCYVRREKDEGVVVAAGEVTGHHHRIRTDRVQMYRRSGEFFLKVANPKGAQLTHEEHETLDVPPGKYRVDHQREYKPQAAPVRVYD